ncbi:unnamed protein product [Cuscuta campestris]|uniref:SHSP domain-containing protein n=1 Tax=Cuscuta campestris TaxID=132261 RepID=A0A484NDH3_9ASTE|nr:unnamed protein product [Cuscuta campestris]VFQ99453.1 unnamed protein product [Cuscuta campestris]
MSLIPSFFEGRRSNVFDPFSMDLWDPLFSNTLANFAGESARETSAFANARIDWKETPEAHVFKADVPGLKKEEGRRSNVFDPFSMDLWDPLFSNTLANFAGESARETSAFANARIDWKETPEAHVFKADVPGLKKEEVKVEVEEGRVLQISGERSKEKEEKSDTWHRVERSSGRFLRRFRLPENARVDQVKAAMENGVLTVTVPKVEQKKPDVKNIQISG